MVEPPRRRCSRSCDEQAGPPAGIGLSGQMHGLVALDSADRPVRPALLWNDQRTGAETRRDRGAARRADAGAGADRQPGADRVHRAEAALDGAPRAGAARARAQRDAAQGLRAPAAVRRAGDRRHRRLGDAVVRRGARGAGASAVLEALEVDPALLPRGAGVRRGQRRRRRTAWPWPPAPATRPPGRSASGSTRPRTGLGRARNVGRRADARCRATPPTRACQGSCHAVADTWFSMGVMLSAAGSLSWLRDVLGAPYETLLAEAAATGRRRRRAHCSCPTSPASAPLTPTPTRAASFTGLASATTAGRSRARCWRASRSGCATCSTSVAASARARASGGSAAAGRAATCGRRSSRRRSSCR